MGPLAADLVYRTVDAVRRFDRYPPPEGRRHWDADAVKEAAHDFVAADGFAARLARLVASANDEESFARVMQTAVRNHFRMQARRTDTGAALRAVSHLLDTDDAVIAAPGASSTSWTLPAYAGRPAYAGNSDDLVAAARSVTDVRGAPWSQTSKRRSPIADRDSLRRVVHAVLAAAAAPVERSQILGAVLARFPLVVTRPVLAADDILMAPSQPADDARLQAAEIWHQLSDNERLVLGCLHEPVRSIAEETGLSRSAAHRARVSARAALADLLADVTDQSQVVARLAEASGVLRRRGTELFDSASSDS